ncbi:hypothetical protein FVEN_g3081 [Fusarium venenatum]|nr:hypothetical protein FVEN_g3081 [Fusarium venenatum]
MSGNRVYNHDDYELVPNPKDHVEILDYDHEDAEWDDCDFEVKKKTSDPKPAASAPKANKNFRRRRINKTRFSSRWRPRKDICNQR